MLPDHVAALVSLPPLSGDAALFAVIVVVLLTVIAGAGTMLALRGLAAHSTVIRRRQAWIEGAEADMHGSFGRRRAEVRDLNTGIEQALSSLPRFDAQVARIRETLAEDRARLDVLRRDDTHALAGTVARIRGTLNVLHRAGELRRTFLG